MKTIDLKTYFQEINYDWKKDEEIITEICRLTKTRVRNPIPDQVLQYGMEQTFLLKAIVDHHKPKNIIEIGTGRGTGAYTMALSESVECVTTIDILPIDHKQSTAIGFESAYCSNEDLYQLVPGDHKQKILFLERKYYKPFSDSNLAFIDGDHTNENVIRSDFELIRGGNILNNGGVVIWDDYGQSGFLVKKVVDSITDVDNLLIEFRGHLFGGIPERGSGIVLMKK